MKVVLVCRMCVHAGGIVLRSNPFVVTHEGLRFPLIHGARMYLMPGGRPIGFNEVPSIIEFSDTPDAKQVCIPRPGVFDPGMELAEGAVDRTFCHELPG